MERVYNFSAGPSMLPLEVLEKAGKEMTNYGEAGMSVMEMSHRSKDFDNIIKEAEALFRELMNVPENYKILFLQGGGSTQFAMVPLNLMTKSGKADYIVTGQWAKKAMTEAKRFGDIRVAATSEPDVYTYIPKLEKKDFREDADYVYITHNNTIYGTRYPYVPDTGGIPLVADMSSSILSQEVDISKYGLIFAGAQKNFGPAGLVVAVIREDLIGQAPESCPTMLNYKTQADNDSLYNTPPTYSIYIAKLVFEWIKSKGGVKALQEINERKAKKLYDAIDASELFNCPVNAEDRSRMNVVFVTGNGDLDKKFVAEAKAAGLVNLGGHRTVGGMRASIYNAMPEEGVDALIDFMKKFEAENK